jgi:hypothetical protein
VDEEEVPGPGLGGAKAGRVRGNADRLGLCRPRAPRRAREERRRRGHGAADQCAAARRRGGGARGRRGRCGRRERRARGSGRRGRSVGGWRQRAAERGAPRGHCGARPGCRGLWACQRPRLRRLPRQGPHHCGGPARRPLGSQKAPVTRPIGAPWDFLAPEQPTGAAARCAVAVRRPTGHRCAAPRASPRTRGGRQVRTPLKGSRRSAPGPPAPAAAAARATSRPPRPLARCPAAAGGHGPGCRRPRARPAAPGLHRRRRRRRRRRPSEVAAAAAPAAGAAAAGRARPAAPAGRGRGATNPLSPAAQAGADPL